jgi:hypothetical protein
MGTRCPGQRTKVRGGLQTATGSSIRGLAVLAKSSLRAHNCPATIDRMIDFYLVPEKTTVTAKGDGPVLDIRALQSRVLLLLLKITAVVEQESLDVSIFGGPEENAMGKDPLVSFPQNFYGGECPLLLDLTAFAGIQVLRAHWEVNRWGRGAEPPRFEFSLKATEVPPELLRERESRQRIAG